jgi:hypothetical protein
MNRDSTIAYLGEWTRWPLGSTYLMASFFTTDDYGDVELWTLEKRAKIAAGFLLCSFVVIFVLALVLPE